MPVSKTGYTGSNPVAPAFFVSVCLSRVVGIFSSAAEYIRGVIDEVKRVKWATKETVRACSLFVLVLTSFVVVFIMCVDFCFIHIMKFLLDVE